LSIIFDIKKKSNVIKVNGALDKLQTHAM